MGKRIKKSLIVALVAISWLLLIKSVIETLSTPMPPISSLIAPVGRLVPLLIILMAAYTSYRLWIAFKAGLRRAVRWVLPVWIIDSITATRGQG